MPLVLLKACHWLPFNYRVLHFTSGTSTSSPLCGLTADGDLGRMTKNAMVKFQKWNKLYADGIVGKNTWAALATDRAG
ncbi:peptidoglycan-binding domain-containing protein [Qipengyuania sp.]|uniref:peptidoglycan-binding domain-containing protein n=1 Tax=Qipengyuania sp. TaxID=2004515 RepID=UPI003AF97FFF